MIKVDSTLAIGQVVIDTFGGEHFFVTPFPTDFITLIFKVIREAFIKYTQPSFKENRR